MRSKRTGKTIKPPIQKLIDNITITKKKCWEWQLKRIKGNYGIVYDSEKGKNVLAHRYFYEQYTGQQIPQDVQVLHKCDNPCCVYPKHLFLGTQVDNMTDMYAKNRQNNRTGENHHMSKLTAEEVLEIRRLYIPMKVGTRELAKKYNVSPDNIYQIIKGRIWKHLL